MYVCPCDPNNLFKISQTLFQIVTRNHVPKLEGCRLNRVARIEKMYIQPYKQSNKQPRKQTAQQQTTNPTTNQTNKQPNQTIIMWNKGKNLSNIFSD